MKLLAGEMYALWPSVSFAGLLLVTTWSFSAIGEPTDVRENSRNSASMVHLSAPGIQSGFADEYNVSTGQFVPIQDQEFAPLFSDGMAILASVEFDSSQPDSDPSPNLGTYSQGSVAIRIPDKGIDMSREGDAIRINVFDDPASQFDQLFAFGEGPPDIFMSDTGLPWPVDFGFILTLDPSTFSSDELPIAPLDWNVAGVLITFLASDFTLRQVLIEVEPSDADADGVIDSVDNCVDAANVDQIDTNADGFGNACDPDLNGDCIVNFADLLILKQVFFSSNADADLNGDGTVNFLDLQIVKQLFFGSPGPSGITNICEPD